MIQASVHFHLHPIRVRCGTGAHSVQLEVTPWHVQEYSNPCERLPAAARRFAGSDCAARVQDELTKLRRAWQDIFFARAVAVNSLGSCSSKVSSTVLAGVEADYHPIAIEWIAARESEPESAIHILRKSLRLSVADAAVIRAADDTSCRRLVPIMRKAVKSSSPECRWAAVQLARRLPQLTAELKPDESWPLLLRLASVVLATRQRQRIPLHELTHWLDRDELTASLRTEFNQYLSWYPFAVAKTSTLFTALSSHRADVRMRAGRELVSRWREPIDTSGKEAEKRRSIKMALEFAAGNPLTHTLSLVIEGAGYACVPYLIESIQHARAEVREVALRALGEIGDLRAFDVAVRQLHDPARMVREAAFVAIDNLLYMDSSPVEDQVRRVVSIFACQHAELQHSAARVIRQLPRGEVISELIRICNTGCTQPALDRVATLLGESRDGRAVACLLAQHTQQSSDAVSLALFSLISSLEANPDTVKQLRAPATCDDVELSVASTCRLLQISSPAAAALCFRALQRHPQDIIEVIVDAIQTSTSAAIVHRIQRIARSFLRKVHQTSFDRGTTHARGANVAPERSLLSSVFVAACLRLQFETAELLSTRV